MIDNETTVRSLFDRMERAHPPTSHERAAIASGMWWAYEAEDVAHTDVLELRRHAESGPESTAPRRSERAGLAILVAASLALVVGFGLSAARTPARVGDDAETATEADDSVAIQVDGVRLETRDSVVRNFGGALVQFDVPAGRTKERSTDNSILLGSRLREPGSEGLAGRILVARVDSLFDGSDLPDGVEVEVDVVHSAERGAVRSLSMVVVGESPIPYATIAGDGEVLVLEVGLTNEVDIVELNAGGGFLVVQTVRDDSRARSSPLLPSLAVE